MYVLATKDFSRPEFYTTPGLKYKVNVIIYITDPTTCFFMKKPKQSLIVASVKIVSFLFSE